MSEPSPAATARRLVRAGDRASLATTLVGEGWPYASLVLTACDHAARPILLLSDLADHARNIADDDRVSLLFDGTQGLDEPLTGARVTVLGRAERLSGEAAVTDARGRYLRRHPGADLYVDFMDFAFYGVAVERAHLVAGFGRIEWLGAADLLYDTAAAKELAEAEERIVSHMNDDHGDALDSCAGALLGLAGEGWKMTGIDPEGCDLRRGGAFGRLDFPGNVGNAGEARAALVRLAELSRK